MDVTSSCDSVEEREKDGKSLYMRPLVPKKNTTSAVWQYFGLRANEKGEPVNTDEAICKLCNKKVTAREMETLPT